jgi:O-antigen ligase
LNIVARDRSRLTQLAEVLAIALAASLPWSTSATSILAVLWLLTTVLAIDLSALRRIALTPAGGFPLVLVAIGVAGMFWAGVPWAERVNGVTSFFKLLLIPFLMCQFSQSGRGRYALIGFLASCILLLIASWLLVIWPSLPFPGKSSFLGIPVKDYLSQAAMFTICIFVIARTAFEVWHRGRRGLALALIALALAFLANVFFVATSRTSLIVLPVLLAVFGARLFRWKGAIGLIVGFIVLAMITWQSPSYLRLRIDSFFTEINAYRPDGKATSAGERLTYWTKSIGFIRTSPLVGHGTGSIHHQFARSTVGQSGMAAEAAANPHNQILAIGIQLGFVGIAALLAMWAAHLALFRSKSFAAWVGLVVVIQNAVGSLFNSHLFDFTHGWVYVVGVGITGGMALKKVASVRH